MVFAPEGDGIEALAAERSRQLCPSVSPAPIYLHFLLQVPLKPYELLNIVCSVAGAAPYSEAQRLFKAFALFHTLTSLTHTERLK